MSRPPRWASRLVEWSSAEHRADDTLGDLEEAHGRRLDQHPSWWATVLTSMEAVDVAIAAYRNRRHPDRAERPRRRPRQALRDHRPSLLDFKLGVRMLFKYPGLTLVGGLAIAFATAVGAGVWEFATGAMNPRMPFEDGDRLVELRLRDRRTADVEWQILHDFELWRDQMQSVEGVGAFRHFERNMDSDANGRRRVLGAEATGAFFQAPGVAPHLGRGLDAEDERPGAPDVVVLGYELWQSHFDADPDVVGRTVELAGRPTQIVGVMPDGFAWPWAHHAWTPFRETTSDTEWGRGASIQVGARLVPGASIRQANAELAALHARVTADLPEIREAFRAEVVPWGTVPFELTGAVATGLYAAMGLFGVGLVVLISCNVALLLFARTAARSSEIVVRSALGAGRGRIVAQLFAEAVVLGLVAAGLGIWAADAGLGWAMGLMESVDDGGATPFWLRDGISSQTVFAALAVSLAGTSLAGIIPALRATRPRIGPELQRSGAGTTDMEFGRSWTMVIVTQIAVTVAFLPTVIYFGTQVAELEQSSHGVPADQYLTARLGVHGEIATMSGSGSVDVDSALVARAPDFYAELKDRLSGEEGVAGVALATNLPGGRHGARTFLLDDPDPALSWGPVTLVGVDFFDVMDAAVLAGRAFTAADFEGAGHVAIVNPAFSEWYLDGRSPIGRRFTLDPPRPGSEDPVEGPWFEIIGVVEQLAQTIDPQTRHHGGIYLPLGPNRAGSVWLAARAGTDPMRLAPRLRELSEAVSPELLLRDVQSLEESPRLARITWGGWFVALLLTAGVAILLSTVGMYSIMSFIVSRRRREIGVRVALGANRQRIARTILARGMKQVSLGIVAGTVLFLALGRIVLLDAGVETGAAEFATFAVYLVAVTIICGAACLAPTRRALAIEPTEALKSD